LTIEFAGDRKETIDVLHKHENDIVKAIIDITKARPVPTPEKDAETIEQYEIHKARKEEQEVKNERKKAARRAEKMGTGISKTA